MKLQFLQPDHWGNLNTRSRKDILRSAVSSINTTKPPTIFFTDEHLLICFGEVSQHWYIVNGYIQPSTGVVAAIFTPNYIDVVINYSLKIKLDWSIVHMA
jgi:hypothetical protein